MEIEQHLLWMPSQYVNLVGDFGVQMYDVMTVAALLIGAAVWTLQLRSLTISWWKQLVGLAIIGVVGVFFTRFFHIIFWSFDQYMAHPNLFLRVGIGRSVHGSMFGFIISALILSKFFQCPVWQIGDRLAWWPPLGLVFTRIGNFWNSEIIGTPSQWPVAVRFYFSGDRGAVPRHPVQLYEGAFCVLLLVVMGLVFYFAGRRKPFVLSAISLIGYSSARFLFDFVKIEPGYWGGTPLTTGQILSIPFFLFGLCLLVFYRRRVSQSK